MLEVQRQCMHSPVGKSSKPAPKTFTCKKCKEKNSSKLFYCNKCNTVKPGARRSLQFNERQNDCEIEVSLT